MGRATKPDGVYRLYIPHFNPRPPWGGRPRHTVCVRLGFRFQSTPSVGRATLGIGLCNRDVFEFQSTPSVGRATKGLQQHRSHRCISIHALRGEGDLALRLVFQHHSQISIHALRGEGDLNLKFLPHIKPYFNPRPPWGGRLLHLRRGSNSRTISIHALRGEGDDITIDFQIVYGIFQSTPSVGRATISGTVGAITKIFQSTPSVGRATNGRYNNIPLTYISIHALRGEGDVLRSDYRAVRRHFNPRPPWGGRRNIVKFISIRHYFNPRPPWGGRQEHGALSQQKVLFQSTPSVGRATKSAIIDTLYDRISIHALRGEGDTYAAS